MTNTYITNATWALTGEKIDLRMGHGDEPVSVFLNDIPLDGVNGVAPAGEMLIPEGARVIDADGKLVMPALFDLHTTINLEGHSKRESIYRAGQAANQGGVWGMLVMPSRGFIFDNAATLDSFDEAVSQRSFATMVPAGCISEGMAGEQQAPYNTLAARGVTILSDGGRMPTSLLMLHRAMKYAAAMDLTFAIRGDVPCLSEKTYMHPGTTSYNLGLHGTPACAEEIGIETLIRLAEDAGARLHIQTVSTAEGVNIIRRAKAKGMTSLTAEVALHHLLYTHENVGDYDTTFKTLPPLREQSDCEALLEGVKDGTIDCIVTDHTPCMPFAKKQDFVSAPQGMVALDTFLPAIYTHLILPGKLSWADVVRACSTAPAAIVNPYDQEEDVPVVAPLLLFDPAAEREVTPDSLYCGTLNSPLLGTVLRGSVTLPISR
ncbi:MAG: amidohydrolase family protein [Akkermansia sp.]|nr:amidohydrolase family protein [Akkermansia sp.]